MENKQLLHVAVETLVLGGVTLFLTKKIKKCKEENEALKEEFNKYKEQNDKNLKYLFSLIETLGAAPRIPSSQDEKNVLKQGQQLTENKERFVQEMPIDPISAIMSQMGVPIMGMGMNPMQNEQVMMMHMQVENPRRRKNVPNIEPVSDQAITIQDDNGDDDISEELQQLNNMNTRNESSGSDIQNSEIEMNGQIQADTQNDEKQDEIFIPEPSKYKKKAKK